MMCISLDWFKRNILAIFAIIISIISLINQNYLCFNHNLVDLTKSLSINQTLQEAKKKEMNRFYLEELIRLHRQCDGKLLLCPTPFEILENKMVKDGYSYYEIGTINRESQKYLHTIQKS